jgi:hypothetical protein
MSSSSSSRSLLYSGEGDASSASGVVILSPLLSVGTWAQARTIYYCCGLGRWERLCTVSVRAAVSSVLGMFPVQRFSQCVCAARLKAFQLRVLECDHACAGCLNGRCRDTLTGPMTSNAGGRRW